MERQNFDELDIPPEALQDPDGFEIMRLWGADGRLHVSLNSGLSGSAQDFAELLSDLYEHVARMYAQRDRRSVVECRAVIMREFLARARDLKNNIEGSIWRDH